MSGFLKKISTAIKNRTTYRTGLLQDKAYRVLKAFTNEALKSYEISSVEWALLGLLYDHREGLKPSVVATELGVEASFVTVMISHLGEKKYLTSKKDVGDTRAKIIFLTDEGRAFVSEVEKYLRGVVGNLIHGIPKSDLISYLLVLEKIIVNGKK